MRVLDEGTIEACKEGSLLYFPSGKAVCVLVSKEYIRLKGFSERYWFWSLGVLTTEGNYCDIELGEYDLFF